VRISKIVKNDWLMYEIKEVIKKIPTADVKERKTGKWIDEGFYADFFPHHAFCCSECGNHLIEIEMIYKYCPFCGARMVNVDD